MEAVDKQPVAAAMHMQADLKDYQSGVYDVDKCPDVHSAQRSFMNHKCVASF